MQRRWQRFFQWLLLILFFAVFGGAFGYWMTSQPLFRETAVQSQPVTWTTLPTPSLVHPQWASYTEGNHINALLQIDDFIWIGTDGGLFVQSLSTGEIAKFKSEHGLASNRVTALAMGVDRSVWVGTMGGVSNFNGRSWQTFTRDDGLSNNQINDLTVTSDGALWVATPSGLDRYDGNRWVNYNAINTAFGLRSQNVRQVTAVPGSDQVWAATDRGLVFFDGRRWEAVGFGNGNLGSDNVFALDMTADGALWIGHQAGLQRLQNGRWDKFTQIDGLIDPEIHWLTAVSSSELWLGYRDGIDSISELRVENGVAVFTHLDTAVHFDSHRVQTVLPLGNTAIAGTADGLYEQRSAAWTRQPMPSEIPSHAINSLVGTLGTVWTGGDFGVGRFDGVAWQFFDEDDGLVNQNVNLLAVGPDQTPYALYGVAGMGISQFRSNGRWETLPCPINAPHSLNIFDGIQSHTSGNWYASDRGVIHFEQGIWEIFTAFHGLPEGHIWDIDEAPDGTIWAAGPKGFAYLDGEHWQTIPAEDARQVTVAPDGTVWGLTLEEIVQIEANTLIPISPIPSPHIGTIDATSDALYLATADGVAEFNSTQRSWRSYSVGEGLPFNRTPVVWVDENEQVWAVSESGPREPINGYFISYNYNLRYVSKLVDNRWQATLVSDKNRPVHGISIDTVLTPDGDLWVGTLAGVSHFDSASWQSYTMANGLLAPEVYQLAYGFEGIWAATQNGVVQLMPHADRGMVSTNRLVWDGEAFLRLTLQTAPDGTIWASNGRSLYQFDGQQWQTFEIDQSLGVSRLDSFAFDENGRLWGGMSLQGELPDGSQRIYLGYFENGRWQWQPIHSLSEPQPHNLQTMAFAPDGRLWAGSSNGVWILDTNQPDFGNTVYGFRKPVEHITDIDFLADGTTLLTSRFENQLITIKNNEVELLPLPIVEATGAHTVTAGDDNTIWIGSNQGLSKLTNNSWETFPTPAFQVEGTTSWLRVLAEDQFWLGSAHSQIISFDAGNVKRLPPFTDARPTERPFTVTAVFPESNGDVTIGSMGGGVAQFDGQRWQRFGSSSSLFDGVVQSITFQDSTAWIGTSDGVITRDVFSGESCQLAGWLEWDDTKVALTAVDNTLWFLGGQVVYWVDEGKIGRGGYQALPVGTAGQDGSVWFATINGLMRHGNGRTRELISDLPTESEIHSLTSDNNNLLWMGTSDGVYTYDRRQWQRWSSADGLADNDVSQVTFAPDGTIWFITQGGLSRYQP